MVYSIVYDVSQFTAVRHGLSSVIFASPEVLTSVTWRTQISSYADRVFLFALDEVHCFTTWYVLHVIFIYLYEVRIARCIRKEACSNAHNYTLYRQ